MIHTEADVLLGAALGVAVGSVITGFAVAVGAGCCVFAAGADGCICLLIVFLFDTTLTLQTAFFFFPLYLTVAVIEAFPGFFALTSPVLFTDTTERFDDEKETFAFAGFFFAFNRNLCPVFSDSVFLLSVTLIFFAADFDDAMLLWNGLAAVLTKSAISTAFAVISLFLLFIPTFPLYI